MMGKLFNMSLLEILCVHKLSQEGLEGFTLLNS